MAWALDTFNFSRSLVLKHRPEFDFLPPQRGCVQYTWLSTRRVNRSRGSSIGTDIEWLIVATVNLGNTPGVIESDSSFEESQASSEPGTVFSKRVGAQMIQDNQEV